MHRALPKWRTNKLYAQDRWAVLLIFQAMDAAGKDGVIKHVMSGVNRQGVQVYSFKAPSTSTEEPNHGYTQLVVAAAVVDTLNDLSWSIRNLIKKSTGSKRQSESWTKDKY